MSCNTHDFISGIIKSMALLEYIENISVKDLPPISKELMMDHYDDFVCDRFLKRKNIEEFLSGSKIREKDIAIGIR